MLDARALDVAYGDAPALWGVSLTIAAGELVAVVGPNGAGKTTLVNAIARLMPIRSGSLRLAGEDIMSISAALSNQALARHLELCEEAAGATPRFTRPVAGETGQPRAGTA